MEPEFNPYAPPQAALHQTASAETDDYWRQGEIIFLRIGRMLPERCVKCNEPAELPLKARKVVWLPPVWQIGRLGCVLALIYFTSAKLGKFWWVAFFVIVVGFGIGSRKAVIHPGLCAKHERQRKLFTNWGLLFPILVVGFAAAGGGRDHFLIFAGVFSIFILWTIVTRSITRVLIPKRIDAEFVRLAGAGRPFLDSLPGY